MGSVYSLVIVGEVGVPGNTPVLYIADRSNDLLVRGVDGIYTRRPTSLIGGGFRMASPAGMPNVITICGYPTNSGLYRSTDYGVTFTALTRPTIVGGTLCEWLAHGAGHDEIYFVHRTDSSAGGTKGGVYYTSNGGSSWTQILPTPRIDANVVNSNLGYQVEHRYVGRGGSILYHGGVIGAANPTLSANPTYYGFISNPDGSGVLPSDIVNTTGAGIGMLATHGTNQAAMWVVEFVSGVANQRVWRFDYNHGLDVTPPWSLAGVTFLQIISAKFAQTGPGVVVVRRDVGGNIFTDIWSTLDFGSTWTRTWGPKNANNAGFDVDAPHNYSSTGYQEQVLDLNPTDDSEWFVLTKTGVLHSTDRAQTWTHETVNYVGTISDNLPDVCLAAA